MNKLIFILVSAMLLLSSITSCYEKNEPKLVLVFRVDSTQGRLNNIGQPAVMPANHRVQHPQFRRMSAHYIELAQEIVQLGAGVVLY